MVYIHYGSLCSIFYYIYYLISLPFVYFLTSFFLVHIIIINLLLLLFITFIHCIYNYIPETNHVFRVRNVSAILYLQFNVYVMLFSILTVFTFTSALSEVFCSAHYGRFL